MKPEPVDPWRPLRRYSALMLLVCAGAVQGQTTETPRERIALVLSGGGALGYAHIGVLQVLQQLRVPVDCVVGTSMGALVGGAWAAGVDPADMRARIAMRCSQAASASRASARSARRSTASSSDAATTTPGR